MLAQAEPWTAGAAGLGAPAQRETFTALAAGLGVGIATAGALIMQGLAGRITLYDRTGIRARGEALDYLHALPLLPIAYFVAAMAIETAGVIFSGQPLGLHSTIIKH